MTLLIWSNDLSGAPSAPVAASVSVALPVVYVYPMRPLWVSESPTDTIMVTPNTPPVGSFQ